VSSVAFSPDGARLASGGGGGPGELEVRDSRTGQVLFAPNGHTAGVTSVAFSPDGARLASGSDDKTVKVWDAHTGQELVTLRGHTGGVHRVAFSPDGGRLASGSDDKTVKVWDVDTGQEVLTLNGHAFGVTSVAFSPEGARLASASWDRTVKVWDARTGQELLTLEEESAPVTSVVFSPDGARLAAGSGLQVKVWDARTGHELLALMGHNGSVRCVGFSPDGARLISGDCVPFRPQPGEVKVWDARTGQELLTLKGHAGWVTGVAFSPDGARLASVGQNVFDMAPGEAIIWDAHRSQELLTLKGHNGVVTNLTFSPDGACLVATDKAGKQLAWDAHTGELLAAAPNVPARPDAALSPDGHTFAWADESVIRLIELRLSEDELAYRRRVTRPDLEWHAEEAEGFAQAGDWFAAAFHLRQRLRAPPDALALCRDLALCQLAAGQEQAYRQTCAALVEQFDKELVRDRAGVGLMALSPCGGFAALPPLAVAVRLKDVLRPAVARAVALGPGTVPAARLLSLAEGVDAVTRALLLHRAGQHEAAVKLLADKSGQRALLVRALAEQTRGRRTEAAQALAQAVRAGVAGLPWDERLELDLLKREAEALLKELPPDPKK
jgi:WD40 repeat protein